MDLVILLRTDLGGEPSKPFSRLQSSTWFFPRSLLHSKLVQYLSFSPACQDSRARSYLLDDNVQNRIPACPVRVNPVKSPMSSSSAAVQKPYPSPQIAL